MITPTVKGLDDAMEAISSATAAMSDFSPYWEALREAFYLSREEMFDTAGASTNTPWPMYSRATNEHRYAAVKASILNKRLTEEDLLRWGPTSPLYDSLTQDRSPGALFEYDTSWLRAGTTHSSASPNQTGGATMPEWAGSYRTPARPMDGIGASFELAYSELLQAFADEVADIASQEQEDVTAESIKARGGIA